MAGIRIRRQGRGRPRTRPGRVLGDKAYSSRAIRSHLRRRRIKTTIPEPAGQQANRRRRGRNGGRPPQFDTEIYKQRNTVERAINKLKGYRAVAARYDQTRLHVPRNHRCCLHQNLASRSRPVIHRTGPSQGGSDRARWVPLPGGADQPPSHMARVWPCRSSEWLSPTTGASLND